MATLVIPKNARLKQPNFEDGFRPVYYFSRFAGLWPFSIVRHSNGRIQRAHIGLFDGLWAILILSLNLIVSFDAYERLKVKQTARIRSMVFAVFQMCSLLFGTIGIIMDMINRNRLVDILRRFNIFDNELSKFGVHFNYKRDYRRACTYLMISSVAALFLINFQIFILYDDPLLILYRFGFNFLHFVIWISVVISFIIFVRSLCERFAVLNALLRHEFLSGNTLKVMTNLCKKDSIGVIKFVGRQHNFLTEIMDQLNICYSFQIMINTSASFILIVMSLYVYCTTFLYPGQEIAVIPWIYTGWLILHTTGTLMIIYHSSSLTKEGRRTFRIVHKIINFCNDSEMMQSLGHLSHQTEHEYPVVTCGLFTFNWALLFNIIAATATYLVIIINFSRAQDEN